MKRLAAALLFTALSIHPVGAAITVDDVRSALDAGSFVALEQMFAEAHDAALENRDFAELRNMNGTLFVTANRERLARTQEWLTTFPDSPYAATALAWSHYYRAFLLRGSASWADTSGEGRQAFHNELAKAKSLIDVAVSRADNYLPALDASILLKLTHIDDGSVRPVVDRSLGVAPSAHTINLAINATRLIWGGSLKEILSICATMAHRVPDYDEGRCLINAAMSNEAEGAIRRMALSLLDKRDDPELEYARFSAYVREWSDREGAEEKAIAYHRSTLGPNTDIDAYLDGLRRIRSVFRNALYEIEAMDALRWMVEDRLADNPQSYRLLNVLIEDIIQNADRDDQADDIALAQRHWRETLELGRFIPETWSVGQSLTYSRYGSADFNRRWPYMTNQIYYSNHSTFTLNGVLGQLYSLYRSTIGGTRPYVPNGSTPPDLAAVQAQMLCPMIRVARMIEYLCDRNPADPGCNVGGTAVEYRIQVRRLARSTPQCIWVSKAGIDALTFDPVPVEAFLDGY